MNFLIYSAVLGILVTEDVYPAWLSAKTAYLNRHFRTFPEWSRFQRGSLDELLSAAIRPQDLLRTNYRAWGVFADGSISLCTPAGI